MAFNPQTASIVGQPKFNIQTAKTVEESPLDNVASPSNNVSPLPETSRAVKELSEFGETGELMQGQDIGARIKAALAGVFTPNTDELAQMLRASSPDIGITQTPQGDLIANNNKTGAQVVINKPGLSFIDIAQTMGIAGALTPASMVGKFGASTLGKMALVGAASGGTQAAIEAGQVAGGGEFNISDVAITTAGGAAFEGIFQGLSRAFPIFRESIKNSGGQVTNDIRQTFKQEAVNAGKNPDEITDDVIMDVINPKGAAIEGEKEFGIGLTKGQRGGTQGQLRREDDLLTGRSGNNKSQEIMLVKARETEQQARDAAVNIQRSFGDDALITSQQEAGQMIKQGIKSAEQEMDSLVSASRDEIGDALLSPDSFKRLLRKTKNAVRGLEFPTDGKIAPATNELLKNINKSLKLYERTPKNVTLKPLHIQQLEQVRRSIGAYIKGAANPTDKRNMVVMQRAFDGFLDDAMKNALFSGDESALAAMKNSRRMFKEYAQRFRANPKRTKSGRAIPDRPGNLIEDIIEANPTDVQVVNSIFGAGKTFGNQAGKAIASKMKDVLGKESPEWNAVRQAAFKRIIQTFPDAQTINGKQTLKFLNETSRKNPELLKEIFSKSEIELMKRFASQVQRSQPQIERGMVNPSGSGLVVNEGTKAALAKITEMLGWTTGNPLLIAAGRGVKTGKGAAKEAVRPFEKIINARSSPIAASTASSLKLAEDKLGDSKDK